MQPQIKKNSSSKHMNQSHFILQMFIAQSFWPFATPWTAAHQAPLSMEFFRQEYWSGLLFSSPGDLPDPRIDAEQVSCIAGSFFTVWATRKSKGFTFWNLRSPDIVPPPPAGRLLFSASLVQNVYKENRIKLKQY